MVKEKGPTQSQKKYLNERLDALFNSAFTTLQTRAKMRECDAIRTVLAKAGLAKAEDEARKVMRQIDDINMQYAKVTGGDLVSYTLSPLNINDARRVGGILRDQINEELRKYQEGIDEQKLRQYRNEMRDHLYLSSEEHLDLMGILRDVEARINEIVTTTKALPPAKK